MATPTISKKQAKTTLSAKKRRKETIKNVLATPYTNFWPLLSPEDNKQVNEILTKFLPRLKNPKINVPYEAIKGVRKEERKNFREKYLNQPTIEIEESYRQSLLFGVNDTTKSLEKNEVMCVLIASDVSPRLLVQHVIDQSVLYNVPVLVVKDLREILKNRTGIGSAVFALKKPLKTDLGHIHQLVFNVFENYPVPETHINYNRKLGDTTITTITISDADSVANSSVISVSEAEDEKDEKNYHLTRMSTRQRAFVPEKSGDVHENPTVICLDDSVTAPSVLKAQVTKKRNYRPLVVKRLKGDKNRSKRKMEQFKGK